jgi:MYXO-CTERM domain-containing protein
LEAHGALPTHYPAGNNNYYIWSDVTAIVPEPSQVASGAVLLLGVGGYALRRRFGSTARR